MEVFDTLLRDVKEGVNLVEEKVKSTLHKFEDKLHKIQEVDSLIKRYCEEYKDVVVTLNVGGKIYRLSVPKLLSCKDSLFNKLFIDNKDEFIKQEEFYIDRDPKYFKVIIEYLTLGYIPIPRNDPEPVIEELKFFNMLEPLSNNSKWEDKNVVDYIDYEINLPYLVNDLPVADDDIDSLKTDSKDAGICCNPNGHIVFELDDTVKLTKIDMRGVTINESIWRPSSGQKGSIFGSANKINWIKLSKIPKNYGRGITSFNCKSIPCKYLKFSHTGLFGIGYLKLYQEEQ
jgi:hypothetical protein